MRKTLLAASVALSLLSGQAFADVATYNALAAANINMTTEQANAIKAAEGDALAEEIAKLVLADKANAESILRAAMSGKDKDMVTKIAVAAWSNAPEGEKQTIRNAAIKAAPATMADDVAKATQVKGQGGQQAGSSGQQNNLNPIQTTSGGGGGTVASPNK